MLSANNFSRSVWLKFVSLGNVAWLCIQFLNFLETCSTFGMELSSYIVRLVIPTCCSISSPGENLITFTQTRILKYCCLSGYSRTQWHAVGRQETDSAASQCGRQERDARSASSCHHSSSRSHDGWHFWSAYRGNENPVIRWYSGTRISLCWRVCY